MATEYADRRTAGSPFPREWGVPYGAPYSQERRDWIIDNIETHAAESHYRRLARRDARLAHELQRIQLQNKRHSAQ